MVASLVNIAITIAASVVLVVVAKLGARGLLLGNYAASTIVLLGLWWTMRGRLLPRRTSGDRLRLLLRFGLPTVAAEASVYGLSIIDRYYLYHQKSAGVAGLLLDRGQVRRRDRVHRAGVHVRVAAARLLGHR